MLERSHHQRGYRWQTDLFSEGWRMLYREAGQTRIWKSSLVRDSPSLHCPKRSNYRRRSSLWEWQVLLQRPCAHQQSLVLHDAQNHKPGRVPLPPNLPVLDEEVSAKEVVLLLDPGNSGTRSWTGCWRGKTKKRQSRSSRTAIRLVFSYHLHLDPTNKKLSSFLSFQMRYSSKDLVDFLANF